MKFVNLTTRPIVLRCVDGGVLTLPPAARTARVATGYPGHLGETRWVDDGEDLRGVRVRPATGRKRRTLEHLPDPCLGIGLIVSIVVAEQAHVDGRGLDDLFVALDTRVSGGVTEVHSLQPAATCTPLLRWLAERA